MRPCFIASLGGARGSRTGDQGVKVPALGWLRKLVAPPRYVSSGFASWRRPAGGVQHRSPRRPRTAPPRVWQLREALGIPAHGVVELISMANEYASYLSTCAEYAAQDYMGASTLWGPQQSDFFAAVLRRIAAEQNGMTGNPGRDAPGPSRSFSLGDVGRWRARPHDGYRDFLKGGFVEGEELPAFEWCEPQPLSIAAGDRQVEVVDVGGLLRDRHGSAVVLRGLGKNPDRAIWAAIWLTPLWAERRGVYRFQITSGGHVIESDEFAVGRSPRSACSK